jgi:antigen flippase
LTILLCNIWMSAIIINAVRPAVVNLAASVRQIASYAGRASLSDITSGLMSNIDRLVLISFVSPGELGQYAVVYSFSRLIQIPQVGITMVLFPVMSGRSTEEVKPLHDHALRFTLYTLTGALALFLSLGSFLLKMLYGDQFGDLTVLCDILFLEAGFGCIAGVVTQLYMSTSYPGYISFAQGASLTVAAIALAIFVPALGDIGAAIALLIASAFRLAILFLGVPFRLQLPVPRLYPVRADFKYLWMKLSVR